MLGECALVRPGADGEGEAGGDSDIWLGRRDTRTPCLDISSKLESRRLLHTADVISSSSEQHERKNDGW